MNSEVKGDTNNITEALKKILEKYEYSYDPPKNNDMIIKIYDLYKNKIIDHECEDDDYLTYLGFYYSSIKNNKKLTLKYYDKAINKGNPHAMYNKAIICMDDKKYDEMIKYLKMAVELSDVESMVQLGDYYLKKKDYDNMKKYYLMAIEKNNAFAMINLGHYYLKNDEESEGIKYINQGIETGSYEGYLELGLYYEKKKDYENCKKNYILYMTKEENETYGSIAVIQLLGIIMINDEDPDFLIPYCKKYNYDCELLNKYKIKRNQKKQYMINKQKYTKEDTCPICHDDKTLIIYDCLGHYLCENCYDIINKCPYCNIEKHQIMKKITSTSKVSTFINNLNNDDTDNETDEDDDDDEETNDEDNDEDDNDTNEENNDTIDDDTEDDDTEDDDTEDDDTEDDDTENDDTENDDTEDDETSDDSSSDEESINYYYIESDTSNIIIDNN
jgi:hypothetical protein